MIRALDRLRRKARDLISIVRPNAPPIFLDVCTDYRSPQGLHRPWVADGRLWASDGRIMVCAWLSDLRLSDRELALYAIGDRKVPDAAATIREYWHHPTTLALPRADRWEPCGECKGSGMSCYDPDIPCYDCEGTGRWRNTSKRKVGGSDTYLMSYYVALLREHGIHEVRIPLSADWAVRFDSGPMTGFLMPMTPPTKAEVEAAKNGADFPG